MKRWLTLLSIILGSFALLGIATTATALKLEESDAFCASCHTEPEQTYYERSRAATHVDLASLHAAQATRCIDCHSGAGFEGRLAGLSQGASDLWAYVSGDYAQPASTTHTLGDDSCTQCHADVLTQSVRNAHFHFMLPLWHDAVPDAPRCVDCHVGHALESGTGYVDEEDQLVVCEACHRQRALWRED